MKIRPSSLPVLAVCPKFQSGGGDRSHADAGTLRHEALARLLEGDTEPLDSLSEEDQEAVQWAYDYIDATAPTTDYPLVIETKGSFLGPNLEEITGTPDVVCGPVIYDLKTRPHDYVAQMAAYALMGDHEEVTVHLLYCATQKVETLKFTRQEAEDLVDSIIEGVNDPEAKPALNDHCNWCVKQVTCPAYKQRIDAATVPLKLGQYDPETIETAEGIGAALKVARALKKWCEAVEDKAKEMHKDGRTPAGFREMLRAGRASVSDIAQAFALTGLPQDKFLAACSPSLPELAKAYAELHGMKLGPARKELEEKLEEVISRGNPTISLVNEKTK